MFEISYPYFFLLLPLPLLVWKFAPPYKETQKSVRFSVFERLVEVSGQTPKKGAVILGRVLFQKFWVPFSWILLVCALTKPMLIGQPIEQVKSARDLMVAVDLSGSMATEDFVDPQGNRLSRLDAIKMVLADFATEREHDRLGLIVFGTSPYLQTPFTDDHDTWITLLNETDIAMAGQSTRFGDAIGLAIKLFEGSDSQEKVLIVLTDGNDTASRVPPVEAAKVASARDIKIYPIAIGDPATTGEEALDVETMEAVAETTGGGFYQALDAEQLVAAHDAINQLEEQDYESLSFRPKFSLHHYFLMVVLSGYLLFFFIMTLSRVLKGRQTDV